jgi:hypothetical protein
MSNVVIDIAAQFTGKKAFTASEKAINNLSKSIKRAALGGGIATLMASSVKAFAEDEKAAAMLGNTLKNLGLDAFTASVEAMIDKTQLATGVLDEQLRPAFQKLVTSTGDAIQAQELLQLSLDVSAGSGNDLVTVASDIANVMAGNNKGLKKYALGLSAVELKTMSATEVQLKFLEVYGGASEKASKTFAGSLGRIKAAAEMARESLGKGLVDGLMVATGSQNIDELQKKILDFGKSAGNAFKTLGGVIRENLGLLKSLAITFAAIWTVGKVIAGIEATRKIIDALNKSYKLLRATAVGTAIAQMAVLNPLGALAYGAGLVAAITVATISVDKLGDAFSDTDDEATKLLNTTKAIGNFQMSTGTVLDLGAINRNVDAIYLKKAAAAKLKADKAAAAAKIKADKAAADNAAKLAKAQSIFDIDKIQIEAALKGKISDEEKLRLELQRAILNEDYDLANKLQKQLEASQRATAALQGQINTIKPPTNPFTEMLTSLTAIAALLGTVGAANAITVRKPGGGILALEPEDLAPVITDTKKTPPTNKEEVPVVVVDPIPQPPATNNQFAGLGGMSDLYGFSLPPYLQGTIAQNQAPVTVTVNVEGSVIAQQELVKVVNDAVVTANTQGLSVTRPGGIRSDEG